MVINEQDITILKLIIEEIGFVNEFVNDVSFKQFESNKKKQHATAMALLNIGELSNKLSDKLIDAVAYKIPFRLIVDFRNVIAYDYFALRFADVWKTATEEIPTLFEQVQSLLNEA